MFKKILLLLIAVLAAFAAYVAVQPAAYQVTRSTTIEAPAAAVFTHVNTLKKWDAWSPWAKRDPHVKTTYEGPDSGAGAISRWAGNEDVGKGSMEITNANPNQSIDIKLSFVEPFENSANVDFAFEPAGDATKVTWRMRGENGFVMRAICTLMGHDMDSMIGPDYETGLANLKKVVEKEQATVSGAG